MSSSSLKHQTIDGYVSEYANLHNISPFQAIQTAMCKEFIKMRQKEEKSRLSAQKEGRKPCLD